MCWNGARKRTLGNLSSASLCCPHCTAPQRPQARCSPCVWTDLLLCTSFGRQGRSGEDLCVCTCLFRHMKEFSVFVNAVLLEGLKHSDKLSKGFKNANSSASCISLWQWLLRNPVTKAVKRGSQLKLNCGVILLQTPGCCCMATVQGVLVLPKWGYISNPDANSGNAHCPSGTNWTTSSSLLWPHIKSWKLLFLYLLLDEMLTFGCVCGAGMLPGRRRGEVHGQSVG